MFDGQFHLSHLTGLPRSDRPIQTRFTVFDIVGRAMKIARPQWKDHVTAPDVHEQQVINPVNLLSRPVLWPSH